MHWASRVHYWYIGAHCGGSSWWPSSNKAQSLADRVCLERFDQPITAQCRARRITRGTVSRTVRRLAYCFGTQCTARFSKQNCRVSTQDPVQRLMLMQNNDLQIPSLLSYKGIVVISAGSARKGRNRVCLVVPAALAWSVFVREIYYVHPYCSCNPADVKHLLPPRAL